MLNDAEQRIHAQSVRTIDIENEEFNLVRLLGLHPFPDGNQWCVLWGKNLQDGVAGFGSTPILAVYDFNKNVHSAALKGASNEQG